MRGNRIVMIFQDNNLYPWMSVRQNAAFGLPYCAGDRTEKRARLDAMLAAVGLTAAADRYPRELSGGMRQRVALARALAAATGLGEGGGTRHEPGVLLMDEPFGALDEMTREYMQTELLRIAAETGAAVVFVTHSIPEAVYLSDRVVVMSPRPGRIADVVDVDLPRARSDETREDQRFFELTTRVRDALRTVDAVHQASGAGPR